MLIMYKLKFMIFFSWLFVVDVVYANSIDNDGVYAVMRDIGIKYLISDDRKLPKKDRKKWEKSLSKHVDFDLLNSGMKERIRVAVKKVNKSVLDDGTLAHLQENAVLFLVPRELSDYTRLYLKEMDVNPELLNCKDTLKPIVDKILVLCGERLGINELRVKFINNSEESMSIRFIKTGRWRLANIEVEISERMLMTIGRWK